MQRRRQMVGRRPLVLAVLLIELWLELLLYVVPEGVESPTSFHLGTIQDRHLLAGGDANFFHRFATSGLFWRLSGFYAASRKGPFAAVVRIVTNTLEQKNIA